MTMSLSMTVGTLCATVITVQSANSSLIILWMIASVAESMEAVASSNTNILFLFNNTLPRQNSCLCPTLQFSPSSLTSHQRKNINIIVKPIMWKWKYYSFFQLPEESSLFGRLLIVVLSWHFSRACKRNGFHQKCFKSFDLEIWFLFAISPSIFHRQSKHLKDQGLSLCSHGKELVLEEWCWVSFSSLLGQSYLCQSHQSICNHLLVLPSETMRWSMCFSRFPSSRQLLLLSLP